MPDQPTSAISRRHLLAIAIASFAILFFQIAATRVLSVILWYHWAFLSISLAMLGLGAPGVWFALRRPSPRALSWFLLSGGLAIPAAIVGVIRIGSSAGDWSVVACMGCLLVPMLLLGSAVCMLLLEAKGTAVGRMYGADLVGASIAAALVMPALAVVPTPHAIALIGLLPIAAYWLVATAPSPSDDGLSDGLPEGPLTRAIVALQNTVTSLRREITSLLCCLGVIAVAGTTLIDGPLKIGATKSTDERTYTPDHIVWTPTARLTFVEMDALAKTQLGAWMWGWGTKMPEVKIPQVFMEQDCSAGTPISKFDGNTEDMSRFEFLMFDVTTAGYQVRPPKRVAIIGGGGGRDILTALRAGVGAIDVAEFNPGVIETISTRFKEFSGDIYHAKGVTAHASEGRSFLTRSRGDYDLIQISLIDSWAATAAGAFTLAENNLYTVEAYKLYFQRLSADGLVSTSRWRGGHSRLEAGRLVLLNQQALRELGVARPDDHLMVISGTNVSTVLTSKRPFDAKDIERARAVCDQRGFELDFPAPPRPDRDLDPATLLRDGPGATLARGLLITPSTDDKPFFFQSLPVFGRFDPDFAKSMGVNAQGVTALQILMMVLSTLTLVLFFAPFALGRWLRRREGFWRGSGYFAAIGLSFMFVEIPWLQRFVLYLGHPSVAAAVVIGSLLLGAGIGALRSERLAGGRAARLWPLVPIVLAAGNVAMSPLFEATLGLPEAGRVAIAVALLLPIGFLLGHFFPLGMARFGDENKAWYWAVNGACGVLAGVISLALAMALGFQAVAWIGVGGYVLAGALFATGRRA